MPPEEDSQVQETGSIGVCGDMLAWKNWLFTPLSLSSLAAKIQACPIGMLFGADRSAVCCMCSGLHPAGGPVLQRAYGTFGIKRQGCCWPGAPALAVWPVWDRAGCWGSCSGCLEPRRQLSLPSLVWTNCRRNGRETNREWPKEKREEWRRWSSRGGKWQEHRAQWSHHICPEGSAGLSTGHAARRRTKSWLCTGVFWRPLLQPGHSEGAYGASAIPATLWF